jgi:hypothetical protein
VEEEDPYLLVISAGFSLVPKDESGLEPLRVVMDSNSRQRKKKGEHNFSNLRFYAFEDEHGTSDN